MPSPPPAARTSPAPVRGTAAVMFLGFAGLSATQFHGYLFESKGFTPLQIGILLGAGYAAGLLAPAAQVWAIRRLRAPRIPLAIALGGAGLGIALLPRAATFGAVLPLFFLALFCSAAVHPLTAAGSLEAVRARGPATYFVIRSLGTAGFLAGCIGSWLQPGSDRLAWLYLAFAATLWLAIPVVLTRLRPVNPREAPEDILVNPRPRRTPGFRRALRLLSTPRPLRLLLALGIMNYANAMATLVQGNYIVGRFGRPQQDISLAWIVSTAVEIPLMLGCAWLVRAKGLRAVIGLGLLGTTAKLLLLGLANDYATFLAGLAFHGCFFSGALVGFNLFVDRHFHVADRPSLQSLGALFYSGLPTALGGLSAGLLWHLSGLETVYAFTACIGVGVGLYTVQLMRMLPKGR